MTGQGPGREAKMRRRDASPDSGAGTFGEFFAKQRRTRTKMSLRQFSQAHGFDPGNLSKLERSRLAVPQSRDVLERYARALRIPEGSDDWYEFFDRAAAENGRIPEDLLSDAEVAGKLPVLFRALRDEEASDEEKLRELIEIIRRA
jgi:transcriptional regulator with XRE-family HTH domain